MKSTKFAIGGFAALVALLSAGVVPSAASSASQATTVWKAEPLPIVAGAQWLTCPSPSDCLLTGAVSSGEQPAFEQWNGTKWLAPQSIPLPPNTTSGWWETIRCMRANFCVAVGEAGVWHVLPVAAIWNGKSWSSQLAAKGTSGALFDVSCVSTTFCAAVGYVDGPQRVLAAHWNGKSWTLDKLPASISAQTQLTSVSCVSTTFCVAVGDGAPHPLIVRWNGTAWAAQAAQQPPGAPRIRMAAVSCPATNDCYAVGESYPNNDSRHRYMVHWDGARWSIVDTPAPPGAAGEPSDDSLTALTCTVQVCTAAGFVATYSSTNPDGRDRHAVRRSRSGESLDARADPTADWDPGRAHRRQVSDGNDVLCDRRRTHQRQLPDPVRTANLTFLRVPGAKRPSGRGYCTQKREKREVR